ncbi:MAG: hypothetical protein LJE67_09600 [Salaquimonas sp.]|nr:hypothetical protein [Salaquimonas sp.]
MNRFTFFICITITCTATPAAAATTSLCTSGEAEIFNATLKGTGEIVSVCANSTDKAKWLQFRMGEAGKVEMIFPKKHSGSLKKFVLRRYTRPQTTYLKLEFDDNGKNYAIFESFDAMESPREASSLRIRSLADGHDISETDLERTSEPLNLMRLEDQVKTGEFDE